MTSTWTFEEDFDGDESLGLHIKKGRQVIASLPGISQDDFDNAQMLAAAHDLYNALESIVDNKTLPAVLLIPARVALDKATGLFRN
jgi:hypothetical protein